MLTINQVTHRPGVGSYAVFDARGEVFAGTFDECVAEKGRRSNTGTYSLLLYLNGTFKNQSTGLTYAEAVRFGHEAKAVGRASRIEVWNEQHDRLEYTA